MRFIGIGGKTAEIDCTGFVPKEAVLSGLKLQEAARSCKDKAIQALENRLILLGFWWCCWGELNSRPLPYQGSALPLSYSSNGGRDTGIYAFAQALSGRFSPAAVWEGMSSSKSSKQSAKEDRLKAALKANMARRKAQARARSVKSDEKNKNEKAG